MLTKSVGAGATSRVGVTSGLKEDAFGVISTGALSISINIAVSWTGVVGRGMVKGGGVVGCDKRKRSVTETEKPYGHRTFPPSA